MLKNPNSPGRPRNRLLAALPEAAYRVLAPLLTRVDLKQDEILYEARGTITQSYFPTGAVASALTVMEDGNAIEVATVGHEGLVGHVVAHGSISPNRLIVQIAGEAMRIGSGELRDATLGSAPIRELMASYHMAYMAQMSQSVACNGLHRLEQRCCRWLLMSRDRIGSDDIRLTHEYMSYMIGARRASVTLALGPLQEAGIIQSRRGRIIILDGPGLEARACECYRVVRDEYERLIGRPA